jgi:hypothetical protein
MGDRPESFPGCARVRINVHKKDYGWFVGLVYDPRELPGERPPGPGWLGCCNDTLKLSLIIIRHKQSQSLHIKFSLISKG